MVLGKLSYSPAAFVKNTEVKLCTDCVLRDFQGLGQMDSGGGGCFLFSWGLGIQDMNQSHLNGFSAFRDYRSGSCSTVNGSFCEKCFASPIPNIYSLNTWCVATAGPFVTTTITWNWMQNM